MWSGIKLAAKGLRIRRQARVPENHEQILSSAILASDSEP